MILFMTHDRGCVDFLREMPRMMVSAVDTVELVRNRVVMLNRPPDLIVSIGKASREMLAGALQGRLGQQPGFSICVSPAVGKSLISERSGTGITAFHAGHPCPDEISFRAARYTLEVVDRLEPGANVLALISGGASSLFEMPLSPISCNDIISVYMHLVRSGMPITELNTVRRHLSAVKGGNMLRKLLERDVAVNVFAVSDVPGDQPHDIGSGPFSPDPTTFAEALDIASRIDGFPGTALDVLRKGVAGHINETLKPGSFTGKRYRFHCIASPRMNVERIVGRIRIMGEPAQVFPLQMQGGRTSWIETIYNHIISNRESMQGFWLATYGELEVKIPAGCKPGRGGRATALVLEMAMEAKQRSMLIDIAVLATDGFDGNSGSGGGFLTAEDVESVSADELGNAVRTFDAAAWLEKRDRLYEGTPTGTNLGDILLLRLRPPAASR